MDKNKAKRNLLVAAALVVASATVTLSGLAYIRFFMGLPR
jgi:hypothetical protein